MYNMRGMIRRQRMIKTCDRKIEDAILGKPEKLRLGEQEILDLAESDDRRRREAIKADTDKFSDVIQKLTGD